MFRSAGSPVRKRAAVTTAAAKSGAKAAARHQPKPNANSLLHLLKLTNLQGNLCKGSAKLLQILPRNQQRRQRQARRSKQGTCGMQYMGPISTDPS